MNTNFAAIFTTVAALLIAGCGATPTSPGSGQAGVAPSSTAPALSDVRVRYTGDALLFSATLVPWQSTRFSSEHGGSWCFQLFLDTDECPTGYGRGLDYLVRAIEVRPDGNVHVRRTEGGTGPGGWGESVGMVNLSHESNHVSFTVPLDMLHDDGKAGFVLELYETLRKEDGSIWHEFVVGYEGTSIPTSRHITPYTVCQEPVTRFASRKP